MFSVNFSANQGVVRCAFQLLLSLIVELSSNAFYTPFFPSQYVKPWPNGMQSWCNQSIFSWAELIIKFDLQWFAVGAASIQATNFWPFFMAAVLLKSDQKYIKNKFVSLDDVHSVRLMKSSTLESKPLTSRNFRLSQAKRTDEASELRWPFLSIQTPNFSCSLLEVLGLSFNGFWTSFFFSSQC